MSGDGSVCGAITGGDLTITHCASGAFGAVIAKLEHAGCLLKFEPNYYARSRRRRTSGLLCDDGEYQGLLRRTCSQYMAWRACGRHVVLSGENLDNRSCQCE